MDLILWCHADPVPPRNESEPDFQRRLAGKGRKQAAHVAAWLKRHLPDSTKILLNPAVRAHETAEALDRQFQIVPEFLPGATATQILIAAGWWDNRHPVQIVGHQPTLGQVASLLLFGEEQNISIRKTAAWWITNRAREDDGFAARPAAAPFTSRCGLPGLPLNDAARVPTKSISIAVSHSMRCTLAPEMSP